MLALVVLVVLACPQPCRRTRVEGGELLVNVAQAAGARRASFALLLAETADSRPFIRLARVRFDVTLLGISGSRRLIRLTHASEAGPSRTSCSCTRLDAFSQPTTDLPEAGAHDARLGSVDLLRRVETDRRRGGRVRRCRS